MSVDEKTGITGIQDLCMSRAVAVTREQLSVVRKLLADAGLFETDSLLGSVLVAVATNYLAETTRKSAKGSGGG